MMDTIKNLANEIHWEQIVKTGIRVIFIIAVSWLLAKIIKKSLLRLESQLIRKSAEGAEVPSESEKRIETIVKLIRQGTLLALYLIVTLILLKEVGIEIGPIVASAGIVGVALGFGAQNLVRDIIAGFFIILENQIRVGDVATVNGVGGLVEQINFRTIVLRDLSGVVHIFPNGLINTLSNSTYQWSAYLMEIGVAYKENTDRVIEVMRAVGSELKKDKKFGSYILEHLEVFGVDKFDDSAVIIKARLRTRPLRQWEVGREYLRRIKMAFDEHNIEIPFPHRTIYFGDASKPFDVQIAEKYKNSAEKKKVKKAQAKPAKNNQPKK